MEEQLDIFIDQFYGKYSPDNIPQGDRRIRLKEKLQQNFDEYVGQMYAKYAPDNAPDTNRMASLKAKYLGPLGSGKQGDAAGDLSMSTTDLIQQRYGGADRQIMAGISGIDRGFSQVVSAPLRVIGAGGNFLQSVVTGEDVDPNSGMFNVAAKAVEDFAEENFPRYEGVNETYQNVAEGLGQVGAMVLSSGTSAAPQLAQTGTRTATQVVGDVAADLGRKMATPTGFLGGTMVAAPEWVAAKEQGLSDEEAFSVLLKNYLVGQTEAIPIERMLTNLNRITGGTIAEGLKMMGTQGLTEAIQEGVQTYLTNEIAKDSYDPDRDPLFQVIEAAKTGGIVGLIAPGVMSMATNLPADKKVKLQRKITELQIEAEKPSSGDPQMDAEMDAVDLDPVDKQVLEEIKIAETIKEEQAEIEAGEKLQNELNEGTESTEIDEDLKNAENTESAEIPVSQTPEYKEAVQRIEDLKNRFAELPDDASDDQVREIRRELGEARQVLQQIAGRPSARRSEVKARIEETTGVTKQKKTVNLTPQQALAAQIRIQDRGIKIGRDITQEKLVGSIEQAAKDAKLSPKQVQAIARRAKRVSLTPKSVEKFNAYVNKVVSDADYTDKLSQARTSRKQVNKQRKSPKRSIREKGVMGQFARINPTEVADINEYNELAEIVKGDKPFNIEDVSRRTHAIVAKIYQDEMQVAPAEDATVDSMMAALTAKREADRETDRLQKIADDLNISIDEARLLDESEDPTDSRAERLRQSYIDLAKSKVAEPEVELNKPQTQAVKYINEIDPSLLTTEQLKDYIRVVDRINENGDFGDAGVVAAIGRAQEGWREINKRGMKTLNLTALETAFSSQPMAIQAIFGLPKDAAMFQLYNGIKGMNDAGALAKREAETAADMLMELKKRFPDAFKDQSLFRQGVYQELIRTPEGMDPNEALRINKELIQSSIEKQRRAGLDKEADLDYSFFKPFENAQTMDEVQQIMQRLDPAGKKVIEALINYHETHTIPETGGQTFLDVIQSDNEMFENKETEAVHNYGAPRTWKRVGRGAEVNFDDIVAFTGRRTPKPKQVRSGMSLTMRDRDGAILDFNIHKNAIDNIEKSLTRALAKPYQYQLRNFIKDNDALLKLFGAGNTPESIRKANKLIDDLFNEERGIVFNFERDLINNRRPYPDRFTRGFASVMNSLKKIGYGVTLSGWSQLPKQSTVLVNTARQLGSDAGLLADAMREKSSEAYNRFFRGETVDIRGEQSAILNVGKFYSAADRLEARTKMGKLMNNVLPLHAEKQFKSKWGGAGVLVATDTSVAKSSFLAFYMKYLKDNGVKFEGVEQEYNLKGDKVRQEALAYAKQMVDTMQVVSTTAEQAAAFKNPSFIAELARAFFVPYGSFAASTQMRLLSSYRNVAFGNAEQRKQGWKDIQGTAGEQLAFNVVGQGLKLGLYSAAGALLTGLLDLDDEEQDWEEWWGRTKKQVAKDMLFSNMPVILGSPGEDATVDFINHAYYSFLKLENPDLTEKEYEKDHAPLARYKSYDDKWWDYLGPYGAPIAKVAEAFEFYNQTGNEELSDEQRTLAFTVLVAQIAQLRGRFPADLMNAIRSEFNSQKRMVREAGSGTATTAPRPMPRPIPRPRPMPRPRPLPRPASNLQR